MYANKRNDDKLDPPPPLKKELNELTRTLSSLVIELLNVFNLPMIVNKLPFKRDLFLSYISLIE